MSVIDKIRAKAAADVKHVVLAEGTEPRTVEAAAKIVKLLELAQKTGAPVLALMDSAGVRMT